MKTFHKVGALALLLSAATALAAQTAKVTEAQARAAALAKVPDGTVKDRELEKENGRLIWTFDIARSSSAGITEVHVDAKTGKVVAVTKETASQEAAEAKAERKPRR